MDKFSCQMSGYLVDDLGSTEVRTKQTNFVQIGSGLSSSLVVGNSTTMSNLRPDNWCDCVAHCYYLKAFQTLDDEYTLATSFI